MSGLHGKVARVLLTAATLLSLLFGMAAFFYETFRAVGRFEAMAVAAAGALMTRLQDQCPADLSSLDDRLLRDFLAERHQVPGGHFVFVAIMDAAGKRLASALAHGFSPLAADVLPAAVTPPHQEILWQDGEVFVRVVSALPGARNGGRMQGVFHIEDETREHVIGAAREAVVLTAVTVLLTTLLLYPIITRLHRELAGRSEELLRSHVSILESLGSAIAKRDSDTHAHNFRVTYYAVRLAEAAGETPPAIASLIKGAFLHDLGKIAISDAILLKPGRLTAAEREVMQSHVAHGLDIVCRVPWLTDAMDVVGAHHERWDGAGYPAGLAGEAIPRHARIFAIADVFDALTSRRPYKEPLPLDVVVEMMANARGSHFDPTLLDLFLPLAPALLAASGDEVDPIVKTISTP